MTLNTGQTEESMAEATAPFIVRGLNDRLAAMERDLKSLQGAMKVKNDQVIRLEAENVRLKLVRTDEQLQLEVAGLRRAVGVKDRALVDYKRQLDKFLENEKVILNRMAEAEKKASLLEGTLRTMQVARDSAQGSVAQAEQKVADALAEVAAAVRRSVEADDRAKKATEPFEKLLKLADAIVKKSPSLNRNETEVKVFRDAMEKRKV